MSRFACSRLLYVFGTSFLLPAAVSWGQTDLLDLSDDAEEWRLNLGWEFPGAKGTMTFADEGASVYGAMLLDGDFSEGGAYIGGDLKLGGLQVEEGFVVFEIEYKTEAANRITVRIGDESGQTHQQKLYIESDGEWHRLIFVSELHAGGEHWGGANDGKWYGKPQYISLILAANAWPDKQPNITFSRVLAYTADDLALSRPGMRQTFDEELPLVDWSADGGVFSDDGNVYEGAGSAAFARGENETNQPLGLQGPWIAGKAGKWFVSLARQTQLQSPDNSYRFVGRLLFEDVEGSFLGNEELYSEFGTNDWERVVVLVDAPEGTARLRFEAEVEKAWGQVWVDDLTIALLEESGEGPAVSRIELSSQRLGNLFFPEDVLRFEYEILATREFSEGAELVYALKTMREGIVNTGRLPMAVSEQKGGAFIASGEILLGESRLEEGRYYQLEVVVAEGGRSLAQDSYGLAILPAASNNLLSHAAVPFTVRNWDSRIGDYLRLARRMGIRVTNLWGGWNKSPPYKPWLGAIDLAESLDLQWIMIAASKRLEQGDAEWNGTNLYQGMQAFLRKYAGRGLYAISLGNEPHGDRSKISEYREGYEAVYQAVKDFDSEIEVFASSSGPDENHWLEGIGDYCDSYDFHKYESYRDFPAIFDRYEELMEKYDAAKPIRSTEIGLNSQGLPRYAVACDMAKKVSTFFAEGGATVGWFSILYPDKEGRSQDSFGQAHNMFASQYNQYNAKLDAVAYYHLINSIGDKHFVEERREGDGTVIHRYASENGKELLIVWNELGESWLRCPVSKGEEVSLIRVDGQTDVLVAGEQGIGFAASWEPCLLLLEKGPSLDSIEMGGGTLAMKPIGMPREVTRDSEVSFHVEYDSNTIETLLVEVDGVVIRSASFVAEGITNVALRALKEDPSDLIRTTLVGLDVRGRRVSQMTLEFDLVGEVAWTMDDFREPASPVGLKGGTVR